MHRVQRVVFNGRCPACGRALGSAASALRITRAARAGESDRAPTLSFLVHHKCASQAVAPGLTELDSLIARVLRAGGGHDLSKELCQQFDDLAARVLPPSDVTMD